MKNTSAIITAYGGPEVINFQDGNIPEINNDEILVKVAYSTVTSGDIKLRLGNPFLVRLYYGLFKPKRNVLGHEYSGIVEQVGSDVNDFNIGDKVYGASDMGAHSKYIAVNKQSAVSKLPHGADLKSVASFPQGASAALYFLEKAGLKSGQRILINGASGSVGSFAVQIAKKHNNTVTGVSSTKNINLVKSIGAEKVIDYKKDSVYESPDKYDIIFDTVGNLDPSKAVNMLSPSGKFVTTGFSLKLLFKSIFSSKKNVIIGMAEPEAKHLEILNEMIFKSQLKPVIDREYSFDDIADAHAYVESGRKAGNVVINFNAGEQK